MYALGIDLGTTFTAAATWRDGRAEIAPLGSRAAAIPSVVLLRQDDTFLTGETANRRALTEPGRVAREFKRRLGDPTPILLGGAPYSAEALTGRLLRAVADEVATREGGLASAICVSHPANWGPFKTDLLHQAVRLGNLDQRVLFITEPEAAAAFYAQQQRIEPGAVVAVYDLGGGTFDAAVLRKTRTGFEILGRPEGIERLGGIDFDAAVFNHVSRALGGKLAELDEDEPAAIAAVARLREECTDAKEALSSDTDVTIPVLLPNVSTEVRLTRAELESMVRPALYDSIEALKRALRSAAVTPEQLHSVLLVGGSSRMPIVSQLVGAELGRPVAVDAHPKHAVALGAARVAGGAQAAAAPAAAPRPASGRPATPPSQPPSQAPFLPPRQPQSSQPQPRSARPPAADRPPIQPAAPPAASIAASGADRAVRDATPTEIMSPVQRASSRPPAQPAAPPASVGTAAGARFRVEPRATRAAGAPMPAGAPPTISRDSGRPPHSGSPAMRTGPEAGRAMRPPRDTGPNPRLPRDTGPHPRVPRDGGPPPLVLPSRPRRPPGRVRMILIAILVLAALAAAGSYAGVALAKRTSSSSQGGGGTAAGPTAAQSPTSSTRPSAAAASSAAPVQTRAVPADEQCTQAIKSNRRWVCLTKATLANDKIVIEYQAEFAGSTPNVDGGFHLHVYGGDGTNPAESIEGSHSATPGDWYVEDKNPSVRTVDSSDFQKAIGADAKKVCARIANGRHQLVPDTDGGFHTGNCVPIQSG
jgi:molecular chaperone DnaK